MQLFRLIKNTLFIILYTVFTLCIFYACASIGNPQGGDYDLTPPKFVHSNPKPDAVNFTGNKIELVFDELISLENPSEKVIITPPQKKAPVIKSIGNKVSVELKDSLWPNTTYTLDFTDAIVDNNEKNILEGFSFAFSTGETIDSLIISGTLLNSENLEPMPNILIGLHKNLEDTAFTKEPFIRTTQTNDRGKFWIRNVSHGTYKIYALNDMNRDYRFDQPGEAIAFYDSLIVPGFEPAIRPDTVWKDSLTVDTIKTIHYTRFTPDQLKLFLFKEDFETQYLIKSERLVPEKFTLYFNSKEKLQPEIRLLGENEHPDWFITEFADDRKSIHYWITDSLIYKQDSLTVEANYWSTDTLNNWVQVLDTINLFHRKKELPKKKEKDKKKEEIIPFLGVNVSPQSSLEVYDTIKIVFEEPLWELDTTKILIQQKVDTLFEKRDFHISHNELNPRMYFIAYPWPYGVEYKITIDSAAFTSIYGKWNNKIENTLKTPNEDEYASLYVAVEGIEGTGFGELLDGSDRVVRKSILRNGELGFQNLKPGKYYLRYIDDKNGNGKWDTGNYAEKRHPEPVYYFPSFFELRKYSEIDQNWNVTEIPINRQKPLDITKNKPVEKKPKKDEQRQTKQSNQTSGSQRGGFSSMPMPR